MCQYGLASNATRKAGHKSLQAVMEEDPERLSCHALLLLMLWMGAGMRNTVSIILKSLHIHWPALSPPVLHHKSTSGKQHARIS